MGDFNNQNPVVPNPNGQDTNNQQPNYQQGYQQGYPRVYPRQKNNPQGYPPQYPQGHSPQPPVYPPYTGPVNGGPVNGGPSDGGPVNGGFGTTPPENNLAGAIVGTVLCWPFGLPAILNAVKVNRLWAEGDYAGAHEAAANAVKWKNIAIILGIIAVTINFIATIIISSI